jgi:2,4-dienoyl-CoA reductase-like NADH-dependent reductase (Old Yellow Enzyme family)
VIPAAQPRAWAPRVDAVLVAVVAAALVAVLVLGTHRHSSEGSVASTTAPEVSATNSNAPASATPESTAETVTSADVQREIQAYADAFGTESLDGLAQLFAATIVRSGKGSPTLYGWRAVLNEYRRQFARNAIVGYRLSQVDIQPGAGEAGLSARYTIVMEDGSQSTGSIGMHVVRGRNNGLLIDAIDAEAD